MCTNWTTVRQAVAVFRPWIPSCHSPYLSPYPLSLLLSFIIEKDRNCNKIGLPFKGGWNCKIICNNTGPVRLKVACSGQFMSRSEWGRCIIVHGEVLELFFNSSTCQARFRFICHVHQFKTKASPVDFYGNKHCLKYSYRIASKNI